MTRILIVDDDPLELSLLAEAVARAGYDPVTADGGQAGLALLRGDSGIAAMILDLVMPDLDGSGVLDAMARAGLTTPFILAGSMAPADIAAIALRRGAADYLTKPAAPERVAMAVAGAVRLAALEEAVRALQRMNQGKPAPADLFGRSEGMLRAIALCGRAARNNHPVLIEGEPGTGRTLAARIIHANSERSGRPLVPIDLSRLPSAGMEAALFGEAAGSGREPRPGLLAGARGGTAVLEHVGALSPAAQARLVELVETGEVRPVGGTRPQRLNVRIVGVTDRRLLNLARAGHFRQDLFYRLNVMPIYLPPLRQRQADLAGLVRLFLTRHMAETGRRVEGVSPEAMALLESYDWPGNVRKLEAVCYRAVLLGGDGPLRPVDFPQVLVAAQGRATARALAGSLPSAAPVHIDALDSPGPAAATGQPGPDRFLDEAGGLRSLDEVERELIGFALERHEHRMSRVARALGIGRSTLYRKLKDYGLGDGVQSDAA